MSKLYKAYEHLCYDALDWSTNKGKDVNKARKKFEEYEINSTIFDFNFRQSCNTCLYKRTSKCNSCKNAFVFKGKDDNYRERIF